MGNHYLIVQIRFHPNFSDLTEVLWGKLPVPELSWLLPALIAPRL